MEKEKCIGRARSLSYSGVFHANWCYHETTFFKLWYNVSISKHYLIPLSMKDENKVLGKHFNLITFAFGACSKGAVNNTFAEMLICAVLLWKSDQRSVFLLLCCFNTWFWKSINISDYIEIDIEKKWWKIEMSGKKSSRFTSCLRVESEALMLQYLLNLLFVRWLLHSCITVSDQSSNYIVLDGETERDTWRERTRG